MRITDAFAVRQAAANVELESLPVSDLVKSLIDKALNGENISTTDIINQIVNEV